MRKLSLLAGIKESKYDILLHKLDSIPDQNLVKVRDWLQNVCNNEYNEVRKVRIQLPLKVWENYTALGITGLEEQKELKYAEQQLKRVWKLVPDFTRI